MIRPDGSVASLEETCKSFSELFPASKRTVNALAIRRSRLRSSGQDRRPVSGGEDDEDDDEEDDEEIEDDSEDERGAQEEEDDHGINDEGVEAEYAGGTDENGGDTTMADVTMSTRSGRQLVPLEAAQATDGRASQANERPNRSSAGVIVDHRPAQRTAATHVSSEAGVQLQSSAASASAPVAAPPVAPQSTRPSISPLSDAPTSASASDVAAASASSRSTAPSTSATALDSHRVTQTEAATQPAGQAQGSAPARPAAPVEEATAPSQPSIRPSYAVSPPAAASAPSAPSQAATIAAPVAPPSALPASSHQPLPVLTIPEPNGLRFERCVTGIEIEVSARNRATISWSDPTMATTLPYPPSSSFERLPAFHFKLLANGQVLPVRLPPMTMKRIVGDARGLEMAVVGVATEMGREVCFTGPEGYSMTLAS